jgi:hypothetical protein
MISVPAMHDDRMARRDLVDHVCDDCGPVAPSVVVAHLRGVPAAVSPCPVIFAVIDLRPSHVAAGIVPVGVAAQNKVVLHGAFLPGLHDMISVTVFVSALDGRVVPGPFRLRTQAQELGRRRYRAKVFGRRNSAQ